MLFFVHNLAVYAVMLIIFPQSLSWASLTAIPAFVLLVLNGACGARGRHRDLFQGPDADHAEHRPADVLHDADRRIYEDLLNSFSPSIAERARIAEFNLFLHFLEIIRAPMLGDDQHLRHWLVVLAITVVGWAPTFVIMRYRARVVYRV